MLKDDGVDDVETLAMYTVDMLKAIGIRQGHALKMVARAKPAV